MSDKINGNDMENIGAANSAEAVEVENAEINNIDNENNNEVNEASDTADEQDAKDNGAADEKNEERSAKKVKKSARTAAFKSSFKTKDFRFGTRSSALTAVVIAVAVVVNVLAGHLPGSLNSIDMSSADIYSIGSQTEALLDSLEEDITISVLSAKDSSDENINNLLDRYEKGSKHITVKYIDTSTDVGASDTYSNYSSNSLIVTCGSKESVIDYYDIYQTDYSSYYTTGTASTDFDGEGQITSAINKVTSENSQMMYYMTGHGESEISTSVSSMISKQNMLTSDLNLLAEDVPEDCSVILLNGPTSDIGADEASKLIEYINNGGNLMVMLAYTDNSQPNLEKVLNTYGIEKVEGIVMETSGNSYNYPINIFAGIESTSVTSELASEKANIIMTYAIGLRTGDAENVDITELLSSSDGAYSKIPADGQLATLEKESGDINGPFSYAVMAEYQITENSDDAEDIDLEDEEDDTLVEDTETDDAQAVAGGKLVVVSSETLIEDAITQQLPVANLEFFMNCVVNMCGENSGASVSIEPKSLDIEYITVPSLHAMIWMAVCIILIPLAIFITGLVIWLMRRKR